MERFCSRTLEGAPSFGDFKLRNGFFYRKLKLAATSLTLDLKNEENGQLRKVS